MDEQEKEAIIALVAKMIRENDEFATLIAQKVFDRWAQAVGTSILKRLAWLLGFGILALALWLASKGIIKLPAIEVH